MGSNGQQRGFWTQERPCDEQLATPKTCRLAGLSWLCPRRESNLDLPLRRRSSYPLDYEGAGPS
jgi:hypothetical protein